MGHMVSPLEAGFLSRSGASPTAGLDAALTHSLVNARAKWPTARVDEVAFAELVGERAGARGLEALDELETDDLYLVCGCLAHDPGALASLRDLLVRGVPRWAAGVGADPDDLAQRVLDRLVVADESAAPRLARFEGRAPLVAYLKTVTRNLAISLARSEAPRESAASASSLLSVADGPEHDAMRLEFREAFDQALERAFAGLDAQKRAVIAMHYGDGVELEAIAKVYRVHRVTVSRWLADARRQVFDATRDALRSELSLSDSEFESVLVLVRSRIDISMSTIRRLSA